MPIPSKDELMKFIRLGKRNVITSTNIAKHFKASDGKVEVPIRKAIREFIEAGELIGSTSKGYFIIETQSEFDEYIASLEGRIAGINTRIEKLNENWSDRNRRGKRMDP